MLKWDTTLTTDVTIIDTQHKELFDRINMLFIAMRNDRRKDDVIILLDYLEDYVIKLFNDEEVLQKKTNYPDYNQQHTEHDQFRAELEELRKTLEATGISSLFVINTEYKLIHWCKNHIGYTDKEFGEFLKINQLN